MTRVWILLRSRSGIFLEPEIFYTRSSAIRKRDLYMAKGFSPAYDEIEVFEKRVSRKSRRAGGKQPRKRDI